MKCIRRIRNLVERNETDCPERGNSFVEQYENYSQKTMAGEDGKTEKFWMIYVIMLILILCFTVP